MYKSLTDKKRITTTYKNNAQTCLESKFGARLLSGLSCGQSRSPARTVFIRDVASNVMKHTITLILILILSTSVQAQREIDLEFLKGEWISDSLRTSEPERWRDFVFIDSLGQFYRTTWWSENYVLDKKLKVEGNRIKKNNDEQFKIVVIDSNTIELNGNNYYGLFKRDPWPNIGNFQESLNRFIVGDSIKKIITGGWILTKFEAIQTDNNDAYPQDYLNSYKNRDFLNQSVEEKLEIKFNANNKFEITGNNGKLNYRRFMVDDEKIQLWKSDYIISLDFEFMDNNLVVIENKHGIKRKLIFEKLTD